MGKDNVLTEMQEISGKGKVFEIGGEEFEVLPATLGQLEEVADLFNEHVHPVMIANFWGDRGQGKKGSDKGKEAKEQKTKEQKNKKSEALYKILGMAFGGKVPQDKLKMLRRDQAKQIIDFFLVE